MEYQINFVNVSERIRSPQRSAAWSRSAAEAMAVEAES